MKSIWKWILGLVVVLVIIATVGLMARGFFVSRTTRVERFEDFHNPMLDGFDRDGKRGPNFGYDHFRSPKGGFNHGMPMHGGRRFGGYGFMRLPFMFLGGLLWLIFPLAVLAAVVYFSYQAGKKAGMNTAQSLPESEPMLDVEPEESPKKRGRKVAQPKE